tara:strand:+ start:31060 stop:32241 length:1182 start_codon:yes stop_codon:yes gene_type:complete
MHLLERYALATGAKIDKPFILEKFYPIPFEKYITVHPNSQYPSKNYDYWNEVLNIIGPSLIDKGINLVQIGTENDAKLPFCYHTNGATNINQVAYIVKNSILHLGADSFPVHVASSYSKKIVVLYGNAYAKNANPYWGNEEDQILLEPNREFRKPSFAPEENPKSINSISPEKIAKSVLNLLKISHDINHETVYCGVLYNPNNIIYETTLEKFVDLKQMNLPKILCRLDFNHNEEILAQQLERGPCELVMKNPVNIDILNNFKNNIVGIIYHIDEDDDPDFVNKIYSLGVEVALVSELSESNLAPKKINYMDAGLIRPIKHPQVKNNELKNIDINKLYYKSNKFTFSYDKIYPSKWAWMNDMEIKHKDELSKVPDHTEFWQEANNFRFVLETS